MANDDDGFPRKSSRTRKVRSAVRERNEESSPATPRCRSPPHMRNTSSRTSRDLQPGTSSTSRSKNSAPQKTNRCKRTLYLLQHPIHMFAPNRFYFKI